MMYNNIVSLSGGKDSTALLLMMLEKNMPVHSAVFFDTGWEFPQMHEHIEKLGKTIDIPIIKLHPKHSFDNLLYEKDIISRKGENKGKIHRKGNGWPSFLRRWCTRQKINTINKYLKSIPNAIQCIGFAADEKHRVDRNNANSGIPKIYPLIEWGITEEKALEYCYDKGFNWGGLYNHFQRVSCFCCPLQRIGELRKIRLYYPELWTRMLEMDRKIKDNRGFRGYNTVFDLEKRFTHEDPRIFLK